jgi:hypothetical protein
LRGRFQMNHACLCRPGRPDRRRAARCGGNGGANTGVNTGANTGAFGGAFGGVWGVL